MTRFFDAHRDRFAVADMCRVLGWNPSTYYAYHNRASSNRALGDADLLADIRRVHHDNYGVYGARKVWIALNREGLRVARCTVERLMRREGLRGAIRGRPKTTTTPARHETAPADLLDRDVTATAPDQRWVADLTYVRTHRGFVHVAFIIDCYARMIVGWALATHLRTELALDALEMALWRRQPRSGLIHHCDAGGQYPAVAYTERLAAAGIASSIGSVSDSFDNALAETVIGIYKTELIYRHGPWPTPDQVELATLEWIDWYCHRRLHEALGDIPPAEYEAAFYAANPPTLTEGTAQ